MCDCDCIFVRAPPHVVTYLHSLYDNTEHVIPGGYRGGEERQKEAEKINTGTFEPYSKSC